MKRRSVAELQRWEQQSLSTSLPFWSNRNAHLCRFFAERSPLSRSSCQKICCDLACQVACVECQPASTLPSGKNCILDFYLAKKKVVVANSELRVVQVRRSNLRQTDGCRRAVQVSAAVAEAPPGAQIANEDGYNVTEEKLSGSCRRSTVIAPAKQCKRAWTRMIKQARKEIKAPGFRDMKSVRLMHHTSALF